MIVTISPDERSLYRKTFRGPHWREVSLALRVEHNACEVCRRRPCALHVLEGAHLIAEVELWALGLHERYLFDPRGLACLCSGCHKAFDLDLGVLSAARMSRLEAARARGRYRRFAAEFRRLKLRRMRWASTMLRETEGISAAVAG